MASRRCRRFFGLANAPNPTPALLGPPLGIRRVKFCPLLALRGSARPPRAPKRIRSQKVPVRVPPIPSARSQILSCGRYRSEKRELVRASRTRAAVVRASASPRTSCVRGKRWAARDGDAWRLPAALGLHEAAPQKANQFGGSAPPRRGGGGLVRSARCTSATSPHLAALAALPSTSVDASRRRAALRQALANSQQPLFHG